jgi:hypothetical protein
VDGGAAGEIADLRPARRPGRQHGRLRPRRPHGRQEGALRHRHAELVVRGLVAEHAGHPAAAGIRVVDLEVLHEVEGGPRRAGEPERFFVTVAVQEGAAAGTSARSAMATLSS